MKKIFILLITISTLFILQSCEEENALDFLATPSQEGIEFTNSFSSEYLLSMDTEDNTAERFVWEEADFGAPTNITYDLHASIDIGFGAFDIVGSTSSNNIAITVEQLLDYARDLDLDDDPTTTDGDGNPNHSGVVHFQLRAYAGAGTGNNTELFSSVQSLNVRLLEKEIDPGAGCDPILALGDALPDADWEFSKAITVACENDVFTAKMNLTNGTFRFFTVSGDWESGLNYPYYLSEGYTIDGNFEDAMDGDNNFRFIGTPGIYELVIDGVNKTIVLNPSPPVFLLGGGTFGGWDWGSAFLMTEISVDIWELSLEFSNETFRFFTVEGDWDSGLNYPYYSEEGYAIDDNFEDGLDNDNNFRFIGSPGIYKITLNGIDKTITLN